MKYVSTRGKAEILDFEGVTLTGLARDGGLYVPETIPVFSGEEIRAMGGQSYAEIAFTVIKPFVAGSLTDAELKDLLDATYGSAFRHSDVAPLVQTGPNDWILELFHGPTLAFKDFALQLLGRFFDVFSARRDRSLTILGATSGDTGSAAIEATRGRENVKIYMLHPKGRVSDVQRRQMTTVLEPNVVNIAIDGTFDDCQALVKAAFNDLEFRDSVNLTAVNSINWARVMAQVVYYFTSAVSLGAPDRQISYSVPTGNFGDIFAGYIARAMGLPIEKLIVATNKNDILAKTLQTGTYRSGEVSATLSPSMDIQVSSNFERLVFDLTSRDGDKVQAYMDSLAARGEFTLDASELETARKLFLAHQVDDAATLNSMRDLYQTTGYSADPHTAIGVRAAEVCLGTIVGPIVTLATAHPVKFGDVVERAISIKPTLPLHMADLMEREERMEHLPNDLGVLMERIKSGK